MKIVLTNVQLAQKQQIIVLLVPELDSEYQLIVNAHLDISMMVHQKNVKNVLIDVFLVQNKPVIVNLVKISDHIHQNVTAQPDIMMMELTIQNAKPVHINVKNVPKPLKTVISVPLTEFQNQIVFVTLDSIMLKVMLNVKLATKSVPNVNHTQIVQSVPHTEFQIPNQIANAQMENLKIPMDLVENVTYNVKLVKVLLIIVSLVLKIEFLNQSVHVQMEK